MSAAEYQKAATRPRLDRGVIVGIGLLAVMMVGIAVTSYLNTQRLAKGAAQLARSRELIDAITNVQLDTVRLQADLRVYLVTGFEDWLAPYRLSKTRLREDAKQLAILTDGDAEHSPRVKRVLEEIETGIAGFDSVVEIRGGAGGHDAVVQLSRERGPRSFVDPLLQTLAEIQQTERGRLAIREVAASEAFQRTVIYDVIAALLGLTAVVMFVWILGKSTRSRIRDSERLADQRELLSATLSSIGDAVIATDVEGRVVFLNPVAEELTGWAAAEASGVPLERVFHIVNETTRRIVENPATRSLQEGTIVGLANHTILIAKGGREFPIDDSAAPIRSNGKVTGAVLVFRDITQKKLADELLRRSEERRQLALDGAELGAWHFDPVNKELRTDERFRQISGCNTIDLNYEMVIAAIHPDDQLRVREAVTAAIRRDDPVPYDIEYRVCQPNGALRWAHSKGRATFGEADGRLVSFDGTIADITANKLVAELERLRAEELSQADRKKDDFIALLAHELRNPLAPIRNGLQVIKMAEDPAAIENARNMMERQLSHMVRLIDDLLDISRISRNKMELRQARVNLSEVISCAVESARPAIDDAGHELTITLPPQPVFLDADLTRLAQVFSNLLTNSAKYTHRGGHIGLSAECATSNVIVTIRDNGIGIPEHSLPTIFNMFSQVDRSIERATGGLGIGLALVKGLVEMHGGRVSAESAGEGQGSTFTVILPTLDHASVQSELPDVSPPKSGHVRKILVVDDNIDGANSLALMLKLMGNVLDKAHDGIAAVERAEQFRPDIILMDVGMPRLNGIEATQRIRQTDWGKDILIVALTGWGQESDKQRTKEAGCNGHLVKPVKMEQLLQVLNDLEKAQSA